MPWIRFQTNREAGGIFPASSQRAISPTLRSPVHFWDFMRFWRRSTKIDSSYFREQPLAGPWSQARTVILSFANCHPALFSSSSPHQLINKGSVPIRNRGEWGGERALRQQPACIGRCWVRKFSNRSNKPTSQPQQERTAFVVFCRPLLTLQGRHSH